MKFSLLVFPVSALLVSSIAEVAFAQKWDIVAVWSGTKIIPDPNDSRKMIDVPWVANGSNANTGNVSINEFNPKNIKSSGEVTFTYTWDPELSGLPAPPEVIIIVSGSATASVSQMTLAIPPQYANPSYSAMTSLSVPNVVTVRNPTIPQQFPTGQSETKSQSKVTWEKVSASGGTFTKTYSLSGETGINYNNNGGRGEAKVSLTIHATPYNLVLNDLYTDGTDSGKLYCDYKYNSTTGNLADLTSSTAHERVTYPGGNPYNPPAPFSADMVNPTILPATPMTSGILSDIHSQVPTASPYSNFATFVATQQYEYLTLRSQSVIGKIEFSCFISVSLLKAATSAA